MGKRGAAVLLSLLAASAAAPAGTISGRVTLVRDGKELTDASNVVVWVEGAGRPGGKTASGEMKSASKRFQPRVVAVPKGGTVDFPNADPIYHNVFSVSGNNRFDLGLYRGGASRPRTFEEVGVVRVYCNIHPQMVGFVLVVDSDAFAITGPDGTFRIVGVPAGARVVRAWHEEAPAEAATPVTATSGEVSVPIRIDLSGFQPESHKNKYGKDYKPPPSDSDDERY